LDVAEGGLSSSSCLDPYRVHAWVKSLSRDALFIEGAEVTLRSLDRRAIVFNRVEPVLPNPYEVAIGELALSPAETDTTDGVIALDLMPDRYIAQLDRFDGKRIIADVKLIARNEGGERVVSASTTFGIDLCVRCLTMCLERDVFDEGLTPDVLSDPALCQDNAGADGVICFDPDC
jgi:hypothetical protein